MAGRRGIELSMNVIIISIVAVTVLLVVLGIFIKNMQDNVTKISGECKSKGGECRSGISCGLDETPFPSAKCPDKNQICCIRK